ncbi:MAG TPA: TolC family protein, partial [Phycisphaerales bacterium]|nr:TolC family protein [Phycisphaerales bacterium]
ACGSSMEQIDRRVERVIGESADTLGSDTIQPRVRWNEESSASIKASGFGEREWTNEHPATLNPKAEDLRIPPGEEEASVEKRLEGYQLTPEGAIKLDLSTALMTAFSTSREYRFAEEDYLLAALRLLMERHRWGPIFFAEVSANMNSVGDGGLYDSSLDLVSELSVTNRLPYGGQVSARALANATEDLHERVAGEDFESADVLVQADIPLLRGAGTIAREDLIQDERNLIYAARTFERFRREFCNDIVRDFLNLVVQQKFIENSKVRVESLMKVQEQEEARYRVGRSARYQAALAEQSTLFARDTLNSELEQYRLAVDRFKIRIGLSTETDVVILQSELGLATPGPLMDQSVNAALQFRLDLQTTRDEVDDSKRALANAKNGLLPDLNLHASAGLPTDNDRRWWQSGFRPDDSDFHVGLTLDLPVDREIERLQVRQAEIGLARSRRGYEQLRDDVVVSVRSAVRDIDRARYSLQIQEKNIDVAQQRVASLEAAPERAEVRDRNEAVEQLYEAKNQRDTAKRDLQLAILNYLLETGQLRVTTEGQVKMPRIESSDAAATSPASAPAGVP